MTGGCSACGRTQAGAGRLFSARPGGNAGLSICEHCVAEAAMAINDAPTRIPGTMHACDYCGRPEDQVVLVAVGSRKICDECVDAFGGQAT